MTCSPRSHRLRACVAFSSRTVFARTFPNSRTTRYEGTCSWLFKVSTAFSLPVPGTLIQLQRGVTVPQLGGARSTNATLLGRSRDVQCTEQGGQIVRRWILSASKLCICNDVSYFRPIRHQSRLASQNASRLAARCGETRCVRVGMCVPCTDRTGNSLATWLLGTVLEAVLFKLHFTFRDDC